MRKKDGWRNMHYWAPYIWSHIIPDLPLWVSEIQEGKVTTMILQQRPMICLLHNWWAKHLDWQFGYHSTRILVFRVSFLLIRISRCATQATKVTFCYWFPIRTSAEWTTYGFWVKEIVAPPTFDFTIDWQWTSRKVIFHLEGSFDFIFLSVTSGFRGRKLFVRFLIKVMIFHYRVHIHTFDY